jgi:8-oxo-dGTP pyrophosphatase MutT (NUDIX family)
LLPQSRTVQQVATLPFVAVDGRVELLLITSRRRKRWIVPKGWPDKGGSLAEAAAREAGEEAGVRGPVGIEPLGAYSYDKRMAGGYDVRCHVFVYPLLVVEHRLAWPERRQRRMRWVGLAEAAALVDDRDLAQLLGELATNDGAPLLDFMRDAAA